MYNSFPGPTCWEIWFHKYTAQQHGNLGRNCIWFVGQLKTDWVQVSPPMTGKRLDVAHSGINGGRFDLDVAFVNLVLVYCTSVLQCTASINRNTFC